MTFPILFENSTVGEANVSKKGLYYYFDCQCVPPDSDIYRIVVTCEGLEQGLGICVPNGKYFVLSKKIPIKSIPEGGWEILLRPKDAVNRIVVPVSEDEPFPFLEKIDASSMFVENEETFITFKDEG